MALQLKRAGVAKVRPLGGGLEEWLRLGLPMEDVPVEEPEKDVLAAGER